MTGGPGAPKYSSVAKSYVIILNEHCQELLLFTGESRSKIKD
jgi:hypothetical protein